MAVGMHHEVYQPRCVQMPSWEYRCHGTQDFKTEEILLAGISCNGSIEVSMPRIEVKIGTAESPLNSPSDGICKGKGKNLLNSIAFKSIVYRLIYP
jgi:hypothetical protein